ncbi:MAG: hypothetical protein M3282_10895 [Gemmatimonadota bacterium]|nr:hypothetical protein [Gemmatimonadota bacterium]
MIGRRFATLFLTVAVGLRMVIPNAGAQESPAAGRLLGLGIGFARAGMSVGGESGRASGLTAHGRIGLPTARRTMLMLDVELQPFEVTNPVGAEAFRATYVLVALQRYFTKRVYARAGAGIQFRQWSGAQRVTSSDAGVAVGAAFGAEMPLRGALVLTPEVVFNGAFIEAEGSVSASLVGVRLGMAWRR